MSSSKIIGCGMLLVLCLISASMAQEELQDTQPLGDEKEEMKREIQGLLTRIQSLLDHDNDTVSKDVNVDCRCEGLTCKCCQRIRISKIGLNKDFSNPKPICVGIPFLTRGASICIELSNLRIRPRSVGGCSTLLVRLFFVTVAKIPLGCFNIKYLDDMDPVNALELPSHEMDPVNALELPPHEMDPVNALELPPHDWIETQHDAYMPLFRDSNEPSFPEVEYLK